MKRKKILCALLSGAMLLTYSGTALAASDSVTGSVDGMSCSGELDVSLAKVTATTKSVPANSSYIYVKATAYMYDSDNRQYTSVDTDSSYAGYMEVSATAGRTVANVHHGRGLHTVNGLSMQTYAKN